MECNYDLRTKLVGDGCSICNPSLAAEHEAEHSRDFAAWAAQVVAEAKKRTASDDVAWLVGDDATMRELGFDDDLDPGEYVDNCLADAAG